MSSIKKSIMLSETAQDYIMARYENGLEPTTYAWSEGINGAISNLKFILNKALPELTEYEWICVLDVFNGTFWDDERIEGFLRISSRMMDHVGALDISVVDPKYADVVRKMHGFNDVQQYAIADMARKFWKASHDQRKGNSYLEIIESLKNK